MKARSMSRSAKNLGSAPNWDHFANVSTPGPATNNSPRPPRGCSALPSRSGRSSSLRRVVERLTLRSTVLLDSDGVRWYIPNSETRRVANESQHKARAKLQLGVAYEADLATAVSTLHAAAAELAEQPQWRDAGAEAVRPPFVAVLGDNAVMLEVQIDVQAPHRGDLERALRSQLLEAATLDNIKMPSSQLDVWLHELPATNGEEPNAHS
jgi:small-conductance mechanosensitive channel